MSLKAPVDKLPLAVRKNIRDELEANRADLEKQLSDLLGGESWKIEVDPNLLYAYAPEDSYPARSMGSCIKDYIEGAIYQLKYFLESRGHGAEGAAEINSAAKFHAITVYPDLEKKNTYCGVDIHDGVLRILFTEGNLGTNVSYALEKLEDALVEAGKENPGLNYTARNSIKQDYQREIETLTKDIRKQLHNDDFKLKPNFEAVGEALKASKDAREDWPRNLGGFIKNYFESLLSYLKYNKFEEDDLMYEGFGEAVTANEAAFRIVEKLTGDSSYYQTIIEDGVLYIQTTPANFGTNISYSCEKIVDLL